MLTICLPSFASSAKEIVTYGWSKFSTNSNPDPVSFTLDGSKMKLNIDVSNKNAELKDSSGNTVMNFRLERTPYFRAYKIKMDGGKEALLVLSGQNGVSDYVVTDFWLVGKYKGKYVIFSRLESAKNSGLIHQGIEVFTVNPSGELWIQGIARYRDCADGYYHGHKAVPSKSIRAYYAINAVSYFWDENAQWFGIRYNDAPLP